MSCIRPEVLYKTADRAVNSPARAGTSRETHAAMGSRAERIPEADAAPGAAFPRRPLYKQVKDRLADRIAAGAWRPGAMLPSEFEIAAEFGVSQGTVRKALDEMTAENLLLRRQGRGTFVARHDEERILFQFFRLVQDDGERRFPQSRVIEVGTTAADEAAAAALGLRRGETVVAVERVRTVADTPCIVERLCVPRRLFPRLEKRELPNNLYDLYAREFGVTVARASERLKAVAAGEREATHLGVAAGTPLLGIDRIAYGIGGMPVEWRVSICRTDGFHYACDLR